MTKMIFSVVLASVLSSGAYAGGASPQAVKPMAAISVDLEAAVNTQVKHEFEAAYAYLAMANHFEQQALFGFSHWFTVQFYEEITHARLMMKFLADKGNDIRLEAIQPVTIPKDATALDIAGMGLQAEEEQTGRVHALFEKARAAKAYDLESYMSFFVNEQVQEEANFTDLKQKLKRIGNSPEGLLALDRELALRVMPVVQPLPAIKAVP